MKVFRVTVKRGVDTDFMDVSAPDEYQAKIKAVELYFYDGWHAISAEEL